MPRANRIITTGTTLVLCPLLTSHFGKSAALVLQQLHYWLSKENLSYGIIDDGCQWIRNSYNQWQKQIQLLSLSTIRRAFSDLERNNIIKSQLLDHACTFAGGDQVKFYTINYGQLEIIIGDLGKTRINRPSHFSNPADTSGGAGDIVSKNVFLSMCKTTNTNTLHPAQTQNQTSAKQSITLFKMNTPLKYIYQKLPQKKLLSQAFINTLKA